ncbi:MAG: threonine/serine dehydratase [Acidobacteria bacterium]|nr:threonine/serine dehydratase [Acidobacteriota bacterium]MDW7983430.1 threonine/serine dehydratase [Acidobacteriota bacterium]
MRRIEVPRDDWDRVRDRVYRFARATPLWTCEGLDLKLENLQVTGSFKVRGVANFLGKHEAAVQAGVVTGSSGNHGWALAYVARRMGLRAVVVVPDDVSPVKAERIVREGAELVYWGRTSEERLEKARAIARDRGFLEVPPFDHPDILQGQGTIGLELLEQVPDVGTVYVPVSGGGLISGIALALKTSRPTVRVIGVEPAGLRRFYASFQAGRPTEVPWTATVADGLRVTRPGQWTWAVASRLVDDWAAVTDEEVLDALRWLWTEVRVVAEPSGAAAVAAARRDGGPPPVVAVVSGGNVAWEMLRRVLTTEDERTS